MAESERWEVAVYVLRSDSVHFAREKTTVYEKQSRDCPISPYFIRPCRGMQSLCQAPRVVFAVELQNSTVVIRERVL